MRWHLPAILLSAACGLLLGTTGCASGKSSQPDTAAEKAYLDDQTLEAFDADLKALSLAIERGDTQSEGALRTKIGEAARRHQKALVSALHDDDSTARRAIAGVLLGFTGDTAVVPALLGTVGNEEEPERVRLNALLGLDSLGEKLRDYKDHKALTNTLVERMSAADASYNMRRAALQTYATAFDGARQDSLVPIRDRFLSDPDIRVQMTAVTALGDIGDPIAVPDLTMVGLAHPEPEIRAASAIALGKIADPGRCIPALMDAAADENAGVRREAVDALSRHYGSNPEQVYAALVTGLADFDAQVREASALALARVREARAVEPLLQATGDRTAIVRQAAVESLGLLIPGEREKDAYPLIELLADQNPGVQQATLTALANVTSSDFGNDQARWRDYYWAKYPELDPANMYAGKPKPRMTSGITNTGTRSTSRPATSSNRNTSRTNNNSNRNNSNRNQPNARNNNARSGR
ncbi:MAG: HEAT repeat domain-containing protein [Planctomycetes bacterium]|nr:HEAT repeat domain-containing protein [Planctomycetota bacterium]